MVHVNLPRDGGAGIGAGGGSASGGFFSAQQQQQQSRALGMALPGLVGSPGGPSSDDTGKKIRKPYTITKSRESWTEQEHDKFLEALQLFDRDWKKIEAFVGTKTVIQELGLLYVSDGFWKFSRILIRSHAQKYFLKVQKNGTSAHVPPPRPKRKAAHPYPQKATKNAPLLVQPIPFQASCLLEQGYAPGTDSFSMPRNSSIEGTRPGGPILVENCSLSSCESPCRSQPNCEKHNPGNQVPSLRAMPDFVQVYTFLGSVFDPSTSCHLEKMKEMNPIDVETVLLLMRNLSINLTSPDFEDHMKLLSMYDSDFVEPKPSSVDKLLIAS